MLKNLTFNLKKKIYPPYNSLIKTLAEMGYERVPMVLEINQFSVRGQIIDVFPSNQTHPLRIEYDDETIERLNSFNLNNQRSLSTLTETTLLEANHHKEAFLFQMTGNIDTTKILSQYKIDDYLVHEDYGIGQFKGLVRLTLNNQEGEYLFIKYKEEDKLYLPLDQIKRLHRYQDSNSNPRLNGLHDNTWKRSKDKAMKDTTRLAEDIYFIYKKRLKLPGFACKEDSEYQIEMENEFPYELTPDQSKAIKEVKDNMESTQPMDRLLCGDVGYGKTEVMIRAAFKAMENNKQVAIIAPTTLLADQHFQLFKERYSNYPFNVRLLSRFVTKKDQKNVLSQLKTQVCDCVIGTHRLLQKDIEFKELGLLIIDEEQRFGVKHKETIKKMAELVDVLSVSATPIPRTLYMGLTGAKDCSLVTTPPKNRKPIITIVEPLKDDIVQKAIQFEKKRNGQVFIVYNKVKSIHRRAQKLQKLIPNCRIDYAHGEMDEKTIHKKIIAFINGKIDILLSTTIIENGIDIPNANTIIIEQAQNFGLSQIHQLRGRVGRSKNQAFAYILFDAHLPLKEQSQKRLRAIKEYSALGSGYQLAMKDLEIRGAGNLLGKEQSGHMISVGYELYCKMLEEAVKRVKNEPHDNRFINLDSQKIQLPPNYIPTEDERLAFYERFYAINHYKVMIQIQEDMVDRYGPLPLKVKKIFSYIQIELTNLLN